VSEKVDLKREIAAYRARRGGFDVVDVPALTYLAVDGHGDPNGPAFAAATEALYPLAYALKFASRDALGRDYVVPPLEGLWWADDWRAFTTARDKSAWDWTLLILVPDWVPAELLEPAREGVAQRRAPARLDDVRRETLHEGRCVQTLHVGPFDDEAPVLARMHDEVIPERGLRMRGRHHEVYLGDPRRVAPERMRTILRQPVDPA
jgi:hypothetical protein